MDYVYGGGNLDDTGGDVLAGVMKTGDSKNPFEAILESSLLNYEEAKNFRSLPPALDTQAVDLNLQSPGYKIMVDRDGLYRISYADLLAAGMEVDAVDPRYFQITSQGQDVAITVQGEADGVFDPGDYITFYGEHLRGDRLAQVYAGEDSSWLDRFIYFDDGMIIFWDPKLDATMFEKYTAENTYWLAVGDVEGLRMGTLDGTPGEAEVPAYYWETVHREESHVWWSWHFTGVDTWFWDDIRISAVNTSTYTATLTALATDETTATVRGEVVARNFNHYATPDHHTQVYINDHVTPIDDATWDGHVRYSFEAQTPLTALVEGENQLRFVAHKTENMTSDRLYFDWFEIEYPRGFQAVGDQLDFSTHLTGTYRYQSGGFSDPVVEIYDLTTPLTPTRVLSPTVSPGDTGTYTVAFQTTHVSGSRYRVAAVGAEGVIQTPVEITAYTPPDVAATAGADYLIITHRDFLTAAQRLADYRSTQGYITMVVAVDTLYDAFNYGIYHPIAIKNFLRYAFANWDVIPSYAVLIGDGHWDLRGYREDPSGPVYMPPYLAWVDPWQGEVDSANQIANLVGGEGDPLPDLAIGRIPVESVPELDNVIDKIIAFETSGDQDWQRNLLFVADNTPDSAGDFVASSERVIQDHLPAGYRPVRIYQDDYSCTSASSTPTECAAVRNAITSTLNITGALFVNYTGHGSVGQWSHEQVLRTNQAELLTLDNGDRLPVFLEMTCLTGYWIYPGSSTTSLAVELLRLENAGAVGTFSPTGLGVAQGHDVLNNGFFDAVFKDGVQTLGWAAVAAKLDLFQSGGHFDLIQTYTVFGDPALKIPVTYTVFLPSLFK